MQIKIKCPNKSCGKTLIVDSDMAGKKGKCSTCDTVFMIPAAAGSSQAGGSTRDAPSTKAGELSAERKKASRSGTRKSAKRRPGSKSGEAKKSGEKYLDDYVEEPKPKRSRKSPGGAADFTLGEDDYVDFDDGRDDYADYEDDPPRRSRSRRRPERPRGGRDEFYDDYEDDYEDDAPRGGRRRRDDYDDYDDYDDGYEDDYYEDSYGGPPRGGRSGRRRRSGPNLPLIRAGMMVMAIAGCVFSGAIGIKILIELIVILSSNMGSTSGTIWKVAETLWFGAAVAVIVGYSFLIFFPNKNNSRGLTIAALSVGAINLIVQLVFKIIPMYSDGSGFLGISFTGFGFGGSTVIETLLKIGLMEGLFIAEIILVALAFMAINKQIKDRYNLQSAKQMIIPAGIYGGILIVMGMFALILSESKITSPTAATIWKWVFYLLRVGSQGMLIWYFISYILLMFNTRNAMPRK